MELPSLDPSRTPETLLGDILTYIEDAEKIVTARQTLSLAGLDATVDALCTRILTLVPEDAKEYAPELDHLMQRLTELQNRMVALQDELATTINSLGTRSKAARAYINPTEE
ncbi:MAG: hypothetical protein V4735_01160 [Pseudomonadota bacterium]